MTRRTGQPGLADPAETTHETSWDDLPVVRRRHFHRHLIIFENLTSSGMEQYLVLRRLQPPDCRQSVAMSSATGSGLGRWRQRHNAILSSGHHQRARKESHRSMAGDTEGLP